MARTPVQRLIIKKAVDKTRLFRGSDPSLWQFWEHGVTSSFLYSFLNCLEQTRLSYVEGWSSRHTPLAFEFGSCNHWIFEMMYGKGLASVPTAQDAIALVSQYEQKWNSLVPNPTMKQVEQQQLVYGMSEAVLPYYFDRWSGDFTGTYRYPNTTTAPVKWHSLEKVFKIPYKYWDGKTTYLRGKRDGIFVDRRGKYWVFDTKCRSVINHEDSLETLQFDTQQMLYLYATAMELKQMPAGVIMNIMRRPGHRRGQDEDLSAFLGRIRKDVSNPKRYDHYFIRYEMTVSRDELLTWKKESFDPLMRQVRYWWEGKVPHYMNPNALITKYGRCQLYAPIVKKEFSQCYKRMAAFNELTEDL